MEAIYGYNVDYLGIMWRLFTDNGEAFYGYCGGYLEAI